MMNKEGFLGSKPSIRSVIRPLLFGLCAIVFAHIPLSVHAEDTAQAEEAQRYQTKAEKARSIGQLGPAIRHYYRALYYAPANPETSKALSELLIGLQRFEEAQTILTPALNASPDDPELWINQGLVSERLGDTKSAQSAYQRAADTAQDDPFIQTRAAAFYKSRGNTSQAEALFQRAQALEDTQRTNQGLDNDNVSQ